MKIRTISTLTLVSITGIATVLYTQRTSSPEETIQKEEKSILPIPQKAPPPKPVKTVLVSPKPAIVKQAPEPRAEPIAPAPKPQIQKPRLSPEEQRLNALNRYWAQMAKNFNRQLDQLDREQNPQRRQQLIQTIARYVRVDTLAALDWAATLTNPEEQRAALNAINQNALTGIGARIDSDETGLPVIRNTTILSAVESTGQVEVGDYISGMVKPDGSLVYFKDWPLQKVAQVLRGEAGTEVQLMMERVTPDGVWHSFDVPVQRSLIVMEPSL